MALSSVMRASAVAVAFFGLANAASAKPVVLAPGEYYFMDYFTICIQPDGTWYDENANDHWTGLWKQVGNWFYMVGNAGTENDMFLFNSIINGAYSGSWQTFTNDMSKKAHLTVATATFQMATCELPPPENASVKPAVSPMKQLQMLRSPN